MHENLIAQDDSYTQELSMHAQCLCCPMYTDGLLLWEHLANPVKSWLREWRLRRAQMEGHDLQLMLVLHECLHNVIYRYLVATPGGHSYSKISEWMFIHLPPHRLPSTGFILANIYPPEKIASKALKVIHQPLTRSALWKLIDHYNMFIAASTAACLNWLHILKW